MTDGGSELRRRSLSHVVFLPSTPLLVRGVSSDDDSDIDRLRAVVTATVDAAIAGAGSVLVVAAGDRSRCVGPAVTATFRGFGAAVDVGVGPVAERVNVGWQAGVALDVLTALGWSGPVEVMEVGPDRGGEGPDFDRVDGPVVLLAVGDGSAGLGPKAPGYVIEGSAELGDTVEAAMTNGDVRALAGLNLDEGQRLMAAGVPVWVAVGRLLEQVPVTRAEVVLRSSELGVDYFVASWALGFTS